MTFCNQLGVALFQNIQCKTQFYNDFREAKNESVVILQCGPPSIDDTGNALLIECTIDLLHETMRAMTSHHTLVGPRHLNTLVIDNISAFYWDLRCAKSSERAQWYDELKILLRVIKEKYKCNVLVTGWDNDYEKGFNYLGRDFEPQKLDDLTYLPSNIIADMDYVFLHRVGKRGYISRVFEKLWCIVE